MATFDFLKKLELPTFNFRLGQASASFVGIDIGSDSVKVVQLRKEHERALLETYGELKSARYFEKEMANPGGLLGFRDQTMVELLGDVIREANVTARQAVFSLPSTSSFITVIRFPLIRRDEIEAAIPFEAKKYIPIPVNEVTLDWQIIEEDEVDKHMAVLLAAVPKSIIEKYQRISELAKLELRAVEIESFSLVRSLLGTDRGVVALIHWGAVASTITVVSMRHVVTNHNFGHGSREITRSLAQSLGITVERAEVVKKEVGLSEKPEDRETSDIIIPMVDSTLADFERVMVAYNRTAVRKIERIVLAGGGASLPGLVDHVTRRFGLETVIGNPFSRTVFPAFLQPVLKDVAPNFGVAVGLALRQITPV